MKVNRFIPIALIFTTIFLTGCAGDVEQQDQNIFQQVISMFANGFNLEFLFQDAMLFLGFLRAMIFFLVFTLVWLAIDNVPLFKNAQKKGPKIVIAIIIGLVSILVPTRMILTFLFVYSTIAWILILLGPITLIVYNVIKHKAHDKFGKILQGAILILMGLIVNAMNSLIKQGPKYIIDNGSQELTSLFRDVAIAETKDGLWGLWGILTGATNWITTILVVWGIILIIQGINARRGSGNGEGNGQPVVNEQEAQQEVADTQEANQHAQQRDNYEVQAGQQLQNIRDQEGQIASGAQALERMISTINSDMNSISEASNPSTEMLSRVNNNLGHLGKMLEQWNSLEGSIKVMVNRLIDADKNAKLQLESDIKKLEEDRKKAQAEVSRINKLSKADQEYPQKKQLLSAAMKRMNEIVRLLETQKEIKDDLEKTESEEIKTVKRIQQEEQALNKARQTYDEVVAAFNAKEFKKAKDKSADLESKILKFGGKSSILTQLFDKLTKSRRKTLEDSKK